MTTAARPYAGKVGGDPIMVNYTKASGNLYSGDVVVVGGVPAVALVDIPAFTGGQVLDALSVMGGIYACMADGAIGLGITVYWDDTNHKVTLTAVGNKIFGVTVAGPSGGFEGVGPAADGDTAFVFHNPAGSTAAAPGSVGASTAALGTVGTNAAVLPAGTAETYPVTAADGTVGVIINAADKVSGRKLFIANMVSTAILKVYPPLGGSINGGTVDAAVSSASGKGVILECLSSTQNRWAAW